ncbi:MAG: tyrosine-type recombinase/integrase [Pseudomonadota bacterium]
MKNGLLPLSDDIVAAALSAAREYNLRDTKLPGLALRVLPSGAKRWVMRIRVDGRAKRVTLGDAWRMPVEDARSKAHALLAGDRPDPLPAKSKVMTFEAFAALYRERRAPSWKPSTLYTYDCYLRNTLMPFFEAMPIDGIVTADVARWYHDYGGKWPGGANRALAILRDMFNRAKTWRLIANGTLNPCREIIRHRSAPRGRLLNQEQLQRLGAVLDRYALIRRDQVDIIRLILLTGCRSGEIYRLRWKEVSRDRLNLEDSKTGPRTVLLGETAFSLLRRRRRERKERSPFVFPSPYDPSKPRTSIPQVWRRIRAEAGLADDIRLHDLRHTYASHAVMCGETLMMAGRLLGHRNTVTTERYAHLADRFLLDAAERVAAEILKLSDPRLS